jgi:hypothetical protein
MPAEHLRLGVMRGPNTGEKEELGAALERFRHPASDSMASGGADRGRRQTLSTCCDRRGRSSRPG